MNRIIEMGEVFNVHSTPVEAIKQLAQKSKAVDKPQSNNTTKDVLIAVGLLALTFTLIYLYDESTSTSDKQRI